MKLVVKNNWGHLEYYFNDKRIPSTDVRVFVTFPDGTKLPKGLQFEKYYTSISDHGKSYGVSTMMAYIPITVNGVDLRMKFKRTEDAEELSFEYME